MIICHECQATEQDWENKFTEVDAETGNYLCPECVTEELGDKCREYAKAADEFYGGKL